MGNPFRLSDGDAQALFDAVGADALNALPEWGGILQWNNRYVLVYPLPNASWFTTSISDFAFTDVTGGIPVNGTMIPISLYIQNIPKTQTNSWLVGLYSLPSNFMAIAKERFDQLVAAGKDVAQGAGEIVGSAASGIMTPSMLPLVVIAIGVLYFMYAPKKRT